MNILLRPEGVVQISQGRPILLQGLDPEAFQCKKIRIFLACPGYRSDKMPLKNLDPKLKTFLIQIAEKKEVTVFLLAQSLASLKKEDGLYVDVFPDLIVHTGIKNGQVVCSRYLAKESEQALKESTVFLGTTEVTRRVYKDFSILCTFSHSLDIPEIALLQKAVRFKKWMERAIFGLGGIALGFGILFFYQSFQLRHVTVCLDDQIKSLPRIKKNTLLEEKKDIISFYKTLTNHG